MKHLLNLSAAFVIFAISAAAHQIVNKVGVISIQGAIAGTKDGRRAEQEIEKKVAPKQKEFESRQAELTALQDQYSKSGAVMAEERRNQLARTIDEKKKHLERDMQDSEEDVRAEQQKLLGNLGQRMVALIAKYAKDHEYALIVDDSSPNTPLLYAASSIDITQDIITLYDQSTATGVKTEAVKPDVPKR